ncbi:MAG TPA: hypothetical protein VM912_17900 [Terriglobales bacterium]|nr:hypothetical protein [Terriglobales bacterium]
MSTATVSLVEIAAEWRTARRLYAFYSGLIREFQLDVGHCKELENPVDRAEREVLDRVQKWFDAVDLQVQVAQMRQLLQSQRFGEEEMLRTLLLRHIPQQPKSEKLRDKLDYLLVQYFAAVAPHHPHDSDVSAAEVQQALRPVLGDVRLREFPWTKELENIAQAVDRCSSLSELLDSGFVELGRKTKRNLGESYFLPEALVQVTRFNFRLRLGFFRLMHSDLHFIRKAVQDLEAMGVSTVDCREAGLGSEEPLATLRTLCHQWKKPFREAYRAGQSFRQLGIVRNILAKTVQAHAAKHKPAIAHSPVSVVAPPPEPLPATLVAETENGQPQANSLDQIVESISEQLFASKQKTTVSAVVIGNTREILASWEVKAFVQGGDSICAAIQRAVAARCLLSDIAAKAKSGNPHGIAAALESAHTQAAAIQEQVAKAKDLGDIDSAVSLAATAKRLLTLIDGTEKLRS